MKHILKENINTKQYWDKLLRSGEWGKERGKLYSLLVKYFPKKKGITALDVGCALGYGTITLSKKLPNIKFEACDFSTTGIRIAKKVYGKKINFFVHDIYKDRLKKNYDYILFIETLEHIINPVKVIKKYLRYCNKGILVTVPYLEKGWKEHLYSFDKNSFKKLKGFKRCYTFNKPGTDQKIILYVFEKN